MLLSTLSSQASKVSFERASAEGFRLSEDSALELGGSEERSVLAEPAELADAIRIFGRLFSGAAPDSDNTLPWLMSDLLEAISGGGSFPAFSCRACWLL